MSFIIIESNPTSSGDTCYVNSGSSIYFTVISGITSLDVTYQWYLNGLLVGIESGYTLENPSTDDVVWVDILNCSGTSGISGTSGTSGISGTSGTSGTSNWTSVPANSSSPGVAGQMSYDSSYLYICNATDTWFRMSGSTF